MVPAYEVVIPLEPVVGQGLPAGEANVPFPVPDKRFAGLGLDGHAVDVRLAPVVHPDDVVASRHVERPHVFRAPSQARVARQYRPHYAPRQLVVGHAFQLLLHVGHAYRAVVVVVDGAAVYERDGVARQGHTPFHVHIVDFESYFPVVDRVVEDDDVVRAQSAPSPCAPTLQPAVREVEGFVYPRPEDELVHLNLISRHQGGLHGVRRHDESVCHEGAPTVVYAHGQHGSYTQKAKGEYTFIYISAYCH